jgi:hypothetical protein
MEKNTARNQVPHTNVWNPVQWADAISTHRTWNQCLLNPPKRPHNLPTSSRASAALHRHPHDHLRAVLGVQFIPPNWTPPARTARTLSPIMVLLSSPLALSLCPLLPLAPLVLSSLDSLDLSVLAGPSLDLAWHDGPRDHDHTACAIPFSASAGLNRHTSCLPARGKRRRALCKAEFRPPRHLEDSGHVFRSKNHEHTCGHARNAHFQSRQTLIDTQALTCTTETAPCTDGFRPPRHLSGARADNRVCPKTARGGPARTCTHCLTCATGHVPRAGTARAPAPRLTHWRSCFEYASVDHSCW